MDYVDARVAHLVELLEKINSITIIIIEIVFDLSIYSQRLKIKVLRPLLV